MSLHYCNDGNRHAPAISADYLTQRAHEGTRRSAKAEKDGNAFFLLLMHIKQQSIKHTLKEKAVMMWIIKFSTKYSAQFTVNIMAIPFSALQLLILEVVWN